MTTDSLRGYPDLMEITGEVFSGQSVVMTGRTHYLLFNIPDGIDPAGLAYAVHAYSMANATPAMILRMENGKTVFVDGVPSRVSLADHIAMARTLS